MNTKVKSMFTSAYTKFNQIVERNKANIPEIDIADMLAQNDLLMSQGAKHSLSDYIKK